MKTVNAMAIIALGMSFGLLLGEFFAVEGANNFQIAAVVAAVSVTVLVMNTQKVKNGLKKIQA